MTPFLALDRILSQQEPTATAKIFWSVRSLGDILKKNPWQKFTKVAFLRVFVAATAEPTALQENPFLSVVSCGKVGCMQKWGSPPVTVWAGRGSSVSQDNLLYTLDYVAGDFATRR